ncbi:MAG: hypothetical protein ACLS8R_03960 [Anaeromassilibacillus sp.]
MIISGQGDKSTELYNIADAFAQTLHMVKVADLDTKEDNDESIKTRTILSTKRPRPQR